MKLKLMNMAAMALSALLCLATTGAMAAQEQSETIATTANTVEGTHFTISNGSKYVDGDGMDAHNDGITVTAKNGETITKVVISCTYQPDRVNDGNTSVSSGTKEITNGGGTITVTGVNASTFTFTCSDNTPQFGQFVVYYAASAEPTGYSVSLKEGTEDASNWQGKAGEGEYQVLPLEGVAAGTAVTVKYIGTKKVKSVKAVKKAAADPLAVPLTMEALTAGTIKVNIFEDPWDEVPGTLSTGMKYSVNGGEKTTIYETTTIDVNAGDKVQFYGNGTSTQVYGGDPAVMLKGTAQTKVYGNIMSLIDETGYATLTTLPNQNYVFYGLFYGNTNLTDASGLLLPATTLVEGCYNSMFDGCTSLVTAPALPATTLAEQCYYGMFYGCTSLTTAPVLPATTLAGSCYWSMFEECTSLTAAPALPAETLADWCYTWMFSGCTSLTTAPTLPAETLTEGCYNSMFYGCTSLTNITCLATAGINENESTSDWLDGVAATGTFNRASGANWPTGNNGLPSGWTLVPPAAPAATGHALSASEVGDVVGTDGLAYAAADKDNLPQGVTAVAMIAVLGNASDCANGLAIALEDVSSNKLTWDNSGYENDGKTAAEWCSAWNTSKAVTGGTWRLPSKMDWQYMFFGCGATFSGNKMSYSELASKLETAGGTALKSDQDPYWSSTENAPGTSAWFLHFDGSDAGFYDENEYYISYVRACLAF